MDASIMGKVTSIAEGVEKLLTMRYREVPEYTLEPRKDGEFLDTLVWNGNRVPLFSTHFDQQIRAMAKYGQDPEQNSALNVYSYMGSDVTLDELLFRELDIAEFILHSKIKKVTAFVNKNAVNLIAVMENETTANLELGNTMEPGTHNQCQHRLITKHGAACDRSPADMIAQHQVYLYGKNGRQVFDDDEAYLYGLGEEDVAKVLTLHAIFTEQEKWEDWAENEARYRKVIAAVYESDRLGKTICLA